MSVRRGLHCLVALALLALAGLSCARRADLDELGSFRLSEVAEQGDPARRASVRLVLEGLSVDTTGGSTLALTRYERAIQVDPGNPYAYLALARYHADGVDPGRGMPFLDKAEALLRAERKLEPRVQAHVQGLRGSILSSQGRTDEAEELLARARDLAPTTWGDGRLDPDELL
ncbi:MAG: hypothetical protein JSU66_17115 [Deltaproteobacteria bacterium]|nr:MAG: hypothetical protein JSU66_17115 [Deltaproteobacteria bacterium]